MHRARARRQPFFARVHTLPARVHSPCARVHSCAGNECTLGRNECTLAGKECTLAFSVGGRAGGISESRMPRAAEPLCPKRRAPKPEGSLSCATGRHTVTSRGPRLLRATRPQAFVSPQPVRPVGHPPMNPRGIHVDARHAHRQVDRWRRDALRQARSSQPSPAAGRLGAGAGTATPPALGPGACSSRHSPVALRSAAPRRARHDGRRTARASQNAGDSLRHS